MGKRRAGRLVLIPVVLTLTVVSFVPVKADPYEKRRNRMVDNHIVDPGHGGSITDTRVVEAMRRVPRHRFVPKEYRHLAYRNRPLPIGEGQTISQPYIVALMTQILRPESGDNILEVGTGSGYQAAVLAEIVDHVYTVEILPDLAEFARGNLSEADYENVTVKQGDGYHGWQEYAPFDGIVVTAAPDTVPRPLKNQLKSGGRLVIPVDTAGRAQQLKILEKKEDGSFRDTNVLPVRFVPFLRSDTP